MENLKDILKELQKIRIELKLQFDDNLLLDTGVRIFNSQYINDRKPEQKEIMITSKQKYKLDSLGYQGTYDLSRQTASVLIDSLIKSGEKK